MSIPPIPQPQAREEKSAKRWGKVEKTTALLNGFAALIAASAALYGVMWFVKLPDEHIDSSLSWRVKAGHDRSWRGRDFPDGTWGYSIDASPSSLVLTIDQRPLVPMWGQGPSDSVVTFRYTFDCITFWLVTGADLYTVSDDDHRVFLNGVLVAVDQDHGAGPLMFTNLRPLLRPGHNVITIEAVNYTGPGFVAVDLTIHRGLVR